MENMKNNTELKKSIVGELGVYLSISTLIPGIVYIISGGTDFLGTFIWILIGISFLMSFIGLVFEPRIMALAGLIISIMMAMFALLYPQIIEITDYIHELQQINLFNPDYVIGLQD